AAAALVVGAFVPAAQAAEIDLPGSGATRDPFEIATVDDLRVAADAINTDPGSFGGSSFRLVADLDFGGQTFSGIDAFAGTFDGAGHTISDIVYSSPGESDALSLF